MDVLVRKEVLSLGNPLCILCCQERAKSKQGKQQGLTIYFYNKTALKTVVACA